jgi:hypothetical protein
MDADFLQEQIDKTKALLDAYSDALLQLTSGGVHKYSLDTGQSVQTVTRLDLSRLQKDYDLLLNRLNMLCHRLNGGGGVTGIPGW